VIASGNDPSASLLVTLARAARAAGAGAYLVGGAVRDLLLRRTPVDVDLALEGKTHETAAVVAALAGFPGWRCVARHLRFGTATLRGPGGDRVDVAATREETYAHPGALPVVRVGAPIERDLGRRDFAIHAMAYRLGEAGIKGDLLDPFGGERDLGLRRIRLLHEGSLADDPTRVFRAARYAARLGFTLDVGFVDAMDRAVDSGAFTRISGDRLRRALHEVLEEENRGVAMEILGSLSVLSAVVEEWKVSVSTVRDLAGPSRPGEAWAKLLADSAPDLRERVASRLVFSRALRNQAGCRK
jgi:tRNA nucleotidyltransferase (CCA-adding enzyme)